MPKPENTKKSKKSPKRSKKDRQEERSTGKRRKGPRGTKEAEKYVLMSMCVRKPTIWVPARSDTNRAVESQKQARSLKFRI